MVRVDSQKHIDFALNSPFGGGRPGRVKRRNQKVCVNAAPLHAGCVLVLTCPFFAPKQNASKKEEGGGEEEEEE
jgi:hypothetical protein